MNQLGNLWNSGTRGKVMIVGGGMLLLFCGCCVISTAPSSTSPAATPTLFVFPTMYMGVDALPTEPSVATEELATSAPVDVPTITNTPTQTATSTPTYTKTSTATETEAPTEALPSITIALLDLTSPVPPGGSATLRIQTTPGVTCVLTYTTPSGNKSEAEGLGSTIADGNGICSWTWKIGPGTKSGTGRLRIAVNGTSLTYDIDLVIE